MVYSEKFNAYLFNSVKDMEECADLPEINEFVYDKISKMIYADLESVLLFCVKADGKIYNTILKKEHSLSPLYKCLEKFENNEEYEKCSECLNLIKSLETT